jgi:hypothetical protein
MDSMASKMEAKKTGIRSHEHVLAAKNASFLCAQYRNKCKCGRTTGQRWCANCIVLSKQSRLVFGGA